MSYPVIPRHVLDDDGWRAFVHHPGMVGTDELAVKAASAGAVDDIAKDLAVTIDDAVLAREELVLGMDMKGVGLLLLGAQLTAEILVVDP